VHQIFVPFSLGSVKLLPGPLRIRFDLNRRYLMSLRNENLLQNHYQEAGLWSAREQPHNIHWGWEAPTCQLRGHFLGHWLSGAARTFADDYHWRDGIGPRAGRPRRANIWWGQTIEPNGFGTHEFIHLCRLIGAEPYLC
jgi:Beta-L-arabinofuranosidase, GH127